jgi:predicted thioesterase
VPSRTTIYIVATIEGIKPGIEGHLERVVEGNLLTHHVGGKGTFATPAMIGLMEITCHRSIEHLLPEGHTSSAMRCTCAIWRPQLPGAQSS